MNSFKVAIVLLALAPPGPGASSLSVDDFGAVADGITDNSVAIARTFAACRNVSGGGGVVRFPGPGVYVTGPWEASCNNSIVEIPNGTTIRSVNTTAGWPIPSALPCPEPSQGKTNQQAAPFVLVDQSVNMKFTGGGTIDAVGSMWWNQHCGNWWCPPGHSSDNPAAFRPFMMRIESSRNVTVTNLSFVDPGFWCIVPVHSMDIVIKSVEVLASASSPNTDGIEPMWTSNVHIANCSISNGDDCMTIKSGSHNVLIEDVDCSHSHGITIGSVWYDDVSNVTYRRINMTKTGAGPRIKGRRQGNATISNIRFEDIILDDVGVGLEIDMLYETPGSTVKNIGVLAHSIDYINISGTSGSTASIECLSTRPCRNISVANTRIDGKDPSWKCSAVDISNVTDVSPSIPSSCHLPNQTLQ